MEYPDMATDPSTGLTDQQARFCREYLIDCNATAAYRRAGYKATGNAAQVNSSRLLLNAKCQAYLAQLRRETSEAAQVTLERTLEEIGAIAFANITQAMTWSQSGVTLKDSATLPPNVAAAVESVTDHETESGRRRTVKMHSKMAALSLLADYFGIRDDFNQARATLKRYGLALIEDPTNPTGWTVQPYEG
jgi:phage terminase small subunit